jgi:hypothetical protein
VIGTMTNQSDKPSDPDRAKNGRFQKGHKKRGGRKAGTRNVMTPAFKDAIIQAAEEHGRDGNGLGGFVGYLRFLAVDYPRAFAGLLAKQLRAEARAQGKRRPLSDFQSDNRPPGGGESTEELAMIAKLFMEIEEARASSATAEATS